MKVLYPTGVRNDFYDRNAANVITNYNVAGVAPHGATDRITYTVTAGKKSYLMAATGFAMRDAVATTAGIWRIMLTLQTGGTTKMLLEAQSLNNTVGFIIQFQISQYGILKPGDVFTMTSADASTAGTVQYFLAMLATEFDA